MKNQIDTAIGLLKFANNFNAIVAGKEHVVTTSRQIDRPFKDGWECKRATRVAL